MISFGNLNSRDTRQKQPVKAWKDRLAAEANPLRGAGASEIIAKATSLNYTDSRQTRFDIFSLGQPNASNGAKLLNGFPPVKICLSGSGAGNESAPMHPDREEQIGYALNLRHLKGRCSWEWALASN